MNKTLKLLTLSMALTAPLLLGQIALAQDLVTAEAEVRLAAPVDREGRLIAGTAEEEAWDAYGNSQYSYSDALILADFWNQDVSQAKTAIGNKLLAGYESKVWLSLAVSDARAKAMSSVGELRYFEKSGYSYEDAQAMATFWGDSDPSDGKLRIERNLIMGNEQAVRDAIKITRDR